MATTFEVPIQNSKIRGNKPVITTHQASIEGLLKKKVEACSKNANPVIHSNYPYSSLLVAAKVAFNNHFPLVLSPDAIWITLTQGVARHINANAEELRKKFVNHEGKQQITVMCDGFVRGAADNPWDQVLATFSTKIKEHIGGKTHEMFVSRFSTTGPIEQAASEVVLMDAVQEYFSYMCMTLCGIPRITLEGDASDWKQIYARAQSFGDLGLEWWMPHLNSALLQFIAAAEGNPDISWWQSFFNQDGGSGGPYFDGHVFNLFPYTQVKGRDKVVYKKNRLLTDKERGWGLGDSDLPGALSSAPFIWNYYGEELKYLFVAGLTGVEMDPNTNALKPVCGWAVLPADAPSTEENIDGGWRGLRGL